MLINLLLTSLLPLPYQTTHHLKYTPSPLQCNKKPLTSHPQPTPQTNWDSQYEGGDGRDINWGNRMRFFHLVWIDKREGDGR